MAVARQGGGTEGAGSGSWLEEVTDSHSGFCHGELGRAVLGDDRPTGGSPVGFRRELQFAATMDVFCRFAVSRHTWNYSSYGQMTSFKLPFEVWKVTFIKLTEECQKGKK